MKTPARLQLRSSHWRGAGETGGLCPSRPSVALPPTLPTEQAALKLLGLLALRIRGSPGGCPRGFRSGDVIYSRLVLQDTELWIHLCVPDTYAGEIVANGKPFHFPPPLLVTAFHFFFQSLGWSCPSELSGDPDSSSVPPPSLTFSSTWSLPVVP